MDSVAGPNQKPAPKPLGLLGRDEMNLAEFPITLLTDRVPKDQREAVYQDEIYDERTGRTLSRKLTISAGNYGLTTAVDDEVILALIQMTKTKNQFTRRKVEFSRHELIQLLGWSGGGASYERVLASLRKWASVYLDYENAWRDNQAKAWTTKGFHIIETFEINDSRASGEQLDPVPSYVVWNEVIFESFQAGYLKPLDYDLCMGLSHSTAKRMYRFLDKRFHHKPDWTFDLKELAHEHIGLGRNYDGPAHLKRKLQPAVDELERVGFLEPLPEAERYQKNGRDWKIRLVSRPNVSALPWLDGIPAAPEESGLVAELVKRGVTKATAADLARRHPAETIAAKVDVFDWLTEKQDKRIAKSPAGYLVKSLTDDYAPPQGFVSKAERRRQEEARQAKERQAAEARRRRKEEEARECAERKAIAAYWESLTPEQQAELDAAANANADPEMMVMDDGPLKRIGQRLRRNEYIQQLLKNREPVPAEA
jgi:hypothetical protein